MIFIFLFLLGYSSCDTIRVLRSLATRLELECPLESSWQTDTIKWFNGDHRNPMNLMASSQSKILLYNNFNNVKCGYFKNQNFELIKEWKIDYIDQAKTDIIITSNPSNSKYSPLNETHASLSLKNSLDSYDWNQPQDILRFKCVDNFDYPNEHRVVWLYFKNPLSSQEEIWNKVDHTKENGENVYEIFNNQKTGENRPISYFIRYLFADEVDFLQFQCASYFDSSNTICQSKKVTVLDGGFFKPSSTNWPLIAGIIGGVVGLLLLLLLLLLLICCCLKRRKQKKKSKDSVTKANTGVTIPVNITNNNDSSSGYSASNSFNNSFNALAANSSNVSLQKAYRAQPDYYLNILEVHPDVEVDHDLHSYEEYEHQKVVNNSYRERNEFNQTSYQFI